MPHKPNYEEYAGVGQQGTHQDVNDAYDVEYGKYEVDESAKATKSAMKLPNEPRPFTALK